MSSNSVSFNTDDPPTVSTGAGITAARCGTDAGSGAAAKSLKLTHSFAKFDSWKVGARYELMEHLAAALMARLPKPKDRFVI